VRRTDGTTTTLASPRSRALLVALALADGRSVSVSQLAADLWSDETPPADPRGSIQTVVSRLRSVVGPGLVELTPSGYRFTGTTDLHLASEALRAASTKLSAPASDPARAASDAQAALERWRDQPGADVTDGLREQLEQRAASLWSALSDLRLTALVGAQDWDAALALAAGRAAADPADERAVAALLVACAEKGEVTSGLRAYARLRDALADELGTSPSRGVQEAYAALLRLDASSAAATPTTAALTTAARDQVPVAGARQDAGDGTPSGAGQGGPERPLPAVTSGPSVPAVPGASGASGQPSSGAAPSASSGAVDPTEGMALGLRRAATVLVGRDQAVHDLVGHLRTSRLVTVLGPGGLGKTRIAHEVGWRVLTEGAPLVVVVELASIGTDDDVMPAIAAALGIHESTAGVRIGDRSTRLDVPGQIRDRLTAPGTVLVMDNCEHVLAGAARAVGSLLASTGVRVLATSRAPLEVDGEVAYALPALSSDADAGGPAVELFCQRALAVRADAVLDRGAVARLCTRLDGLPLAIELAAARVRSMTLEEIADGLGRRFLLLTGGARTAPERHRTLRAVIEWSWELLDERERATLRRTSLLPAGFDLPTAEQVAGASWPGSGPTGGGTDSGADDWRAEVSAQVRDDVAALVAQSLLVMTEDPATRTSRFRMLETVREFSLLELEEAGEVDDGQRAVVRWASGLAAEGVPATAGPGQVDVVRAVTTELDNLVQAFRWAVADEDATSALTIFGVLGAVAAMRGTFFEILGLVDDAVALARGARVSQAPDAILTAMLVSAIGRMFVTHRPSVLVGRLTLLSRRPDVVGPAWAEAIALGIEGIVVGEHHSEMLARARGSSFPALMLMGHVAGGAVAENDGALDEAARLGEQGYALAVEQGNTWARASASQLLGQVENERGDHASAARWFTEAHSLMKELGATSDLRQIEISEAGNSLAEGDLDRAEATFRRAASATEQAEGVVGAAGPLEGAGPGVVELRAAGYAGLGEVAWLRGDAATALDRYDRGIAQLPRFGAPASRPWHLVHASARLSLACLDAAAVARGEGAGRPPVRDREQRRALARRLRVLLVANLRTGHGVDSPAVGTALVALGAWMWTDDGARVDDGLELVGLGERLGSRQDVPSLRRTTHLGVARALQGDDRVEAALARARVPADHDAVLARARALLAPRL